MPYGQGTTKVQADEAGKIVTDYGAVLAAPSPLGLVRDIKSLPHLKTEIKAALKLGLSVTTDAEFRDQLKLAYISLANFQKLTEQEMLALQNVKKILSRASDFNAYGAKLVSAEAELINGVRERVSKEGQALKAELEAEGFW